MPPNDPESINFAIKFLEGLRNTPEEVLLGVVICFTWLLKRLGKVTGRESPYVTKDEMTSHKSEIMEHVDNRTDRLEDAMENMTKRIDNLFTNK